VSYFLSSQPQNAIPSEIDPKLPIDPSFVLGFDTRHPDAAVELQAIIEEVWMRHPVILFGLVCASLQFRPGGQLADTSAS
jgi:hypothetical protein